MTTIAIDLEDPARMADLVRRCSGSGMVTTHAAERLHDVADAIEAAADKPIIVLDVEKLQLDEGSYKAIRSAQNQTPWPSARVVLGAVADALDALTPPRPPEPTGHGALVKSVGLRWFRIDCEGPKPWVAFDPCLAPTWVRWDDIPDPIEILSPGVTADGAP